MRGLLLVLALLVGGCSSLTDMFDSKVDYKSSGKLPPLEVPPDLTAPTRVNRYAMPDSCSATLSGYQQERKEQGRTGTTQVLPQVEQMRVERAGNARWLVVLEPAEKEWPMMHEFWQQRGFLTKTEPPVAGAIETAWAENRANLPHDFIRGRLGLFADQVYTTGKRDKYRTRLARTPDGKATEVYIS